jgi:uncharacterized membrane protein YdbT with pleckstrin-like domain
MASETGAVTNSRSHQVNTDGISLLDGEVVIANEHPSWANWTTSITFGIFVGLFALGAIAAGEFGAFFVSLLIVGMIFGYVHLSRSSSRYIVTNQRVKKNVGLLNTSTGETRISDIRSLTTNQGFAERFMGMGSVQIDSTGAGGTLGITGVSDHDELAHLISEQQQNAES